MHGTNDVDYTKIYAMHVTLYYIIGYSQHNVLTNDYIVYDGIILIHTFCCMKTLSLDIPASESSVFVAQLFADYHSFVLIGAVGTNSTKRWLTKSIGVIYLYFIVAI